MMTELDELRGEELKRISDILDQHPIIWRDGKELSTPRDVSRPHCLPGCSKLSGELSSWPVFIGRAAAVPYAQTVTTALAVGWPLVVRGSRPNEKSVDID